MAVLSYEFRRIKTVPRLPFPPYLAQSHAHAHASQPAKPAKLAQPTKRPWPPPESLTDVGSFSNFMSTNIGDAGIKNISGQGNVFGGRDFPMTNALTDYFSFSFNVNATGENKIYLDGFSTDVDSDFRVQWALVLNSTGSEIALLSRATAPTQWANFSLGNLAGMDAPGIFPSILGTAL